MSEPKVLSIGDVVQLGNQHFTIVNFQAMRDAAGFAVQILAKDETLARAELIQAEQRRMQAMNLNAAHEGRHIEVGAQA